MPFEHAAAWAPDGRPIDTETATALDRVARRIYGVRPATRQSAVVCVVCSDQGGPSRPPMNSVAFLEAEEDEPVAVQADREPHAVTRLRLRGVEQGWLGEDRHELHRAHAEPRDGLVVDQDQVGGRTRDDRAAHLIGGGADDRAPDAGDERRQQRDEQDDDDRACGARRRREGGA